MRWRDIKGSRVWFSSLGVMVAILLVFQSARSASAQQTAGASVNPNGWIETWWSWMHWWEANQLSLIRPPAFVEPPAAMRAQAVTALLAATESDRPDLVAEAVLALGKIETNEATGATGVVDRLIELTGHDHAEIRRTAWMALGLVSGDAAQTFFMEDGRPFSLSHLEDLCAWVVGVGLMESPSREVFRLLYRVLTEANALEARRLAAWAMRVHNPPGTIELMLEILHQSEDAQLASEAILAIGQQRSEQQELLLANIFLGIGPGTRLPSLDARTSRRGRQPEAVGVRSAAALALGFYDTRDEARRSTARNNLVRPLTQMSDPAPRTGSGRSAPSRASLLYDWGWAFGYDGTSQGHTEIRLGLISLGRVGGEDIHDYFFDAMSMRYARQRTVPRRAYAQDPNRAMAALGVGLTARHATDRALDAPHRRDRIAREQRRPFQRLERYLNDRSEPIDFRAACALALGLSGQASAREILLGTLEDLRPDEALLSSHVLLALGMLGERKMRLAFEGQSSIDPVEIGSLRRQALSTGTNRVATLAERARVMGLGLLGERDVAGQLLSAFGQDVFVSQSVVRSLKWLGHYDLTEPLIEVLEHPDGSKWELLAAWSLGELYEPRPISRLNRLMQDVNFTLPNHRTAFRQSEVYRFRAYAAPFMHRQLLRGGSDGMWY